MMKRRMILSLLLATLLCLAACDGTALLNQEDGSPSAAAEPTQEVTAVPTAPPTVTLTPAPEETAPPIEMMQWVLPQPNITINVPKVWSEGAALTDMLTESPDVEFFYAVAFAPEGIDLTQDANIGFLYVIKESLWDAVGGKIGDTPVNEIGRANQYVVAYSGFNDNPYVLDSQECLLFDKLKLPTKGSAEVLSVEVEP